tara:strand:- start:82 stop:465 length:384 start_codon:yes stop_codon:yes gene_type:complete
MATPHYELILYNQHGLRIGGYPVIYPKCRDGLTKAIADTEALLKQGFDPELIAVNYRDAVGDSYPVYDVEWGWDDANGTPEDVDAECNDDHLDESMDGDFDSGMASAGFGTDEDYGHFGDQTYGADF